MLRLFSSLFCSLHHGDMETLCETAKFSLIFILEYKVISSDDHIEMFERLVDRQQLSISLILFFLQLIVM